MKKLIEIIKNILISFLMKKRILPIRPIDKDKVNKLIQSLYPYRTQFNLIRLGPKEDGGYLVPDDLDGIEA